MQYRALEEKAISEYHDLIHFFLTDLVLMPPQTPSDTIQISSRHPQTPSRHPRHRPFYAIEGTGRKGNIQVWPISNFANGFGIATSRDLLSPQTHSRHQADTPRHNPDTPSYRIFMQYRSLEEKTISEFHDLL